MIKVGSRVKFFFGQPELFMFAEGVVQGFYCDGFDAVDVLDFEADERSRVPLTQITLVSEPLPDGAFRWVAVVELAS